MTMRPAALGCALLLLLAACGRADGGEAGPATTVAAAPDADDVVAAGFEPPEPAPPPGPVDPELAAMIADFVAQPNTLLAGDIAETMAASGQVQWVPWLIDLYRLGRSTALDDQAATALETLTGREATFSRVDDLVGFGGWMLARDVLPGDGYTEFKVALYERVDPGYADLLPSIDPLTLARVQFGGAARGAIPDLNEPARLTVAEAGWLTDDDLVYGLELSDTKIAYPFRIMGWHELANDVIDGRNVAVALCTLCRTAAAFDPVVDGQLLTFETSGLLLNSNKVMVDRQTDSLWNEITGEAFAGPLQGTVLDPLPLVVTTWGEWRTTHPDTVTLDLPPPVWSGNPDQPPVRYDYLNGSPQASYYADDDLWFPAFDVPDTFDTKAEVVTIARGDRYLAIELDAVTDAGPVVVALGDERFVVVPTSGGARVYDATPAGLSAGDEVVVASADADTATVGGDVLDRVVSGQSFWFAWWGQHPETEVWPVAPGASG